MEGLGSCPQLLIYYFITVIAYHLCPAHWSADAVLFFLYVWFYILWALYTLSSRYLMSFCIWYDCSALTVTRFQFENDAGHQSPPERGKFIPNRKVLELRNKLIKFMEDRIYPMENEFYKLALSSSRWTIHPEEERLKELAKKEGLWNLWIPVCICCSMQFVSDSF